MHLTPCGESRLLGKAIGLKPDHRIVLARTVGYPAA